MKKAKRLAVIHQLQNLKWGIKNNQTESDLRVDNNLTKRAQIKNITNPPPQKKKTKPKKTIIAICATQQYYMTIN